MNNDWNPVPGKLYTGRNASGESLLFYAVDLGISRDWSWIWASALVYFSETESLSEFGTYVIQKSTVAEVSDKEILDILAKWSENSRINLARWLYNLQGQSRMLQEELARIELLYVKL